MASDMVCGMLGGKRAKMFVEVHHGDNARPLRWQKRPTMEVDSDDLASLRAEACSVDLTIVHGSCALFHSIHTDKKLRLATRQPRSPLRYLTERGAEVI